jgi:hypothetical protein
MAYSQDTDFAKYEKRVLDLSSSGEWTGKHDLAGEDIDLRLTAKGIDPAELTVEGKEQLKKASVFRALYLIFDELASMGSELHAARSESYGKRFKEEFDLQLSIGLDADADNGAEQGSISIELVR